MNRFDELAAQASTKLFQPRKIKPWFRLYVSHSFLAGLLCRLAEVVPCHVCFFMCLVTTLFSFYELI